MYNFNVTNIRILKSESVYNADADFDIYVTTYSLLLLSNNHKKLEAT